MLFCNRCLHKHTGIECNTCCYNPIFKSNFLDERRVNNPDFGDCEKCLHEQDGNMNPYCYQHCHFSQIPKDGWETKNK